MKKIIYLHQYFKTNAGAGGTRSFEFATYLSQHGYDVTLITGTGTSQRINNNLYVDSTQTRYSNTMGKIRRIFSFLSFVFKSFIKGLKCKDSEVVFATSTPLTIGIPAVLLAKIKRIPLVFEVRDVWPDVPIELGYIKNTFLIKLLKKFEMWIYKNSKYIIVLSKGMEQNLLAKGIESSKISVIENFSNLDLYNKASPKRNEYDKFLCIHPGTMGVVNGLDFILDVAKIIKERDNEIKFLLVGEGNQKERLLNRVRDEKITNVEIKSSLPKKEIVNVINDASLGFMCVDNKYKILEDNSANKFFDFLAAGLPIVINYEGWQKEVIEKNKIGFSVLDKNKMVMKIIEIKENKELRLQMEHNSRKLAEHQFSDYNAKTKLCKILKKITEKRG